MPRASAKQGRRKEMRTIAAIDRDIDAIYDELKSRYPALRRAPEGHLLNLAACLRWQVAWDAHPDLHELERTLYLERHMAREAEYAVETAEARRAEAVQSDKYPTCPHGKVPLSCKDITAQDLLWEYAQRRRAVDPAFSDDLECALRIAGFVPPEQVKVVIPAIW